MGMIGNIGNIEQKGLPGPQKKYVEEWPGGLLLGFLGYYFTYFRGSGRHLVASFSSGAQGLDLRGHGMSEVQRLWE